LSETGSRNLIKRHGGGGFWTKKDRHRSGWKVREGKITRDRCVGHEPVEVAFHVDGLRVSRVFPFWDDLKCGAIKPLQSNVLECHISARLALFGIDGGQPLLAGVPSGKTRRDGGGDHKEEYRVFEPVFGFALGTLGIVWGGWIMMFTARRHSDWLLIPGVAVLIAGWVTFLYADVVTDIAERAASSVFGASAKCYGRAEDVRVLSAGATPLALGPRI
jgi:hypothetical protein